MAKKMKSMAGKTMNIPTHKAKNPMNMKLPSKGASKPAGGGKKGY